MTVRTKSQQLAHECESFDTSAYRDAANANAAMTALLQDSAEQILAQEQAIIAVRDALLKWYSNHGAKPGYEFIDEALSAINKILT